MTKSADGKAGYLTSALSVFLGLVSVWCGARTYSRGDDFLVFFRTAHGFFVGTSPYDLAAYGNMVFKYPPWILPFFLPLAALGTRGALGVFAVAQGFALYGVSARLRKDYAISEWTLIATWIFFLPILLIQAMVGQLSLFLLWAALELVRDRGETPALAAQGIAFSVKVLTLFPFVAFLLPGPGQGARVQALGRAVLGALFAAVGLSIPLLWFYGGHASALGADWIRAMFSGTHDIHSVRIGFTTREAQGLPSLFLRITGADESNPRVVLTAVAFAAILLAGIAARITRPYSFDLRFLVCLALTPLVQPLAWFHFYLFVLPVFAIALERSAQTRREHPKRLLAFILLGLALNAVTEKTLGDFGRTLEFAGIKTWATLGIVLLAARWKILDPALGSLTTSSSATRSSISV